MDKLLAVLMIVLLFSTLIMVVREALYRDFESEIDFYEKARDRWKHKRRMKYLREEHDPADHRD